MNEHLDAPPVLIARPALGPTSGRELSQTPDRVCTRVFHRLALRLDRVVHADFVVADLDELTREILERRSGVPVAEWSLALSGLGVELAPASATVMACCCRRVGRHRLGTAFRAAEPAAHGTLSACIRVLP